MDSQQRQGTTLNQPLIRSRRQAWILAARPKTLPAAASPVLIGIALAVRGNSFALLPSLAALLCALLLQIGSNLANDYFDFIKGVDTHERVGPTRVAASGLIGLRELRLGMIAVFGLSAAIGLYLIQIGGWPILAVGVASILAALAYTGGPFPFGYHGLGDLFVFIFFGLVAVCGTYYVQTLSLTPMVIVAAVPAGTLVTAILVVNNLRDIDTDRQAGKYTLAVLLGRQGARWEYFILLAVAYAIPVLLWLVSGWSVVVILPWLTLPLALPLVRTAFRVTEGATLNMALANTARLGLLFSLLFSIGIVLSR